LSGARKGSGADGRAFVDRPLVKTVIGLTVVVLAIVTFMVEVVPRLFPAPDEDARQESTRSGGVDGPETPGEASTAELEAGDCLSQAHEMVPCDGLHTFEVTSLGAPCSTDTLIAYLGGISGVDVLNPQVKSQEATVDGTAVCLLQKGTDRLSTMSARDSLLSPVGDAWRWCIDDDAARTVACDMPHTSEVISAQTGSEPLDCERRASEYTETSLSRFTFELSVSARGSEGAQHCVIDVRGDNSLTASLRRLGSGALPIE